MMMDDAGMKRGENVRENVCCDFPGSDRPLPVPFFPSPCSGYGAFSCFAYFKAFLIFSSPATGSATVALLPPVAAAILLKAE